MYLLEAHSSNSKSDVSCHAEVKNSQNRIDIYFKVDNYFPNICDSFSKDYRENEGLWNFDVCEAFLSFGDSSYLEIQSSPNDSPFAYMIKKPREDFYIPKKLDLIVSNTTYKKRWISTLSISKKDIPGSGSLVGNLFVCLGPKDKRLYFALNINSESNPDFHRPDLFKELL